MAPRPYTDRLYAVMACSAVLLLFASAPYSQENADEGTARAEITQVAAPSAPLMRNDSLMYAMDVYFKRLKSKFWSYPDNSNQAVIIELYGLELSAPPVQFPRSSPVQKMSIKNQKTKMALSGRLSAIKFSVDKGWNFEVSQPDTNCLRVSLYKKMEAMAIKEEWSGKKGKPFLSYLGAFFGGAVALSIAMVAVINK